MPALPSVPNVIKTEFVHNLVADTSVTNKLYWRYSGGPPSAGDLDSLCTTLRTAYAAHLDGLLNTAFSLSEIIATDLNLPTGAVGTETSATDGGRSGVTLPISACLVINYQISRRYRGGKPRNYWPFGVAGDVANEQQWASAFLSSVNSNFGALLSAPIGETYGTTTIENQVNVSYYEGFTNYTGSGGRAKVRANQRSSPQVDNVTGWTPNAIVGSQRRRLRA